MMVLILDVCFILALPVKMQSCATFTRFVNLHFTSVLWLCAWDATDFEIEDVALMVPRDICRRLLEYMVSHLALGSAPIGMRLGTMWG